jgi:hypothetical protein
MLDNSGSVDTTRRGGIICADALCRLMAVFETKLDQRCAVVAQNVAMLMEDRKTSDLTALDIGDLTFIEEDQLLVRNLFQHSICQSHRFIWSY